jgi:hypothetical protein
MKSIRAITLQHCNNICECARDYTQLLYEERILIHQRSLVSTHFMKCDCPYTKPKTKKLEVDGSADKLLGKTHYRAKNKETLKEKLAGLTRRHRGFMTLRSAPGSHTVTCWDQKAANLYLRISLGSLSM